MGETAIKTEVKPESLPAAPVSNNVPGGAQSNYIKEVVFVKVVKLFDKFKAGFIYRLKAYPLAIWELMKIGFMNGWEVIRAYKYAVWNGSCRPLLFIVNGKISKSVLIGRLLFLGSYVVVNVPVILLRRSGLRKWFIVGMVAESGLWLVNRFLVAIPDYVIAGLVIPLVPVLVAGTIAVYQWKRFEGLREISKKFMEGKNDICGRVRGE